MGVIRGWMRGTAVAASVLVITAAPQVSAQIAAPAAVTPAAARTIRGTVVDAATDVPLRRVRVIATAGRTPVANVLTDSQGGFVISAVDDQALTVRLTKARYADLLVDMPMPVRRGVPTEIQLAMAPASAITVRVRDTAGQAPAGCLVPVTVRRVERDGTTSALGSASAFPLDTPCNNGDGEYRFGGLPAGRYVIGARFVPPPASALKMSATLVDLAAGQEFATDVVIEGLLPAAMATASAALGGGVIRGRVALSSGVGVEGVGVHAIRGDQQRWSAETDAAGRFALTGLPGGTFTLLALKQGYGTVRPDGTDATITTPRVNLAERQEKNDVDLVVEQLGAISGTVVDEYGEPIQDASVRIIRFRQDRGPMNTVESFAARTTDDRGQFRIAGVAPGAYMLAARLEQTSDADQRREAYAPVYYPGTSDRASAESIDVTPGGHVDGLVVPVRPVPVVRLSGIALDSKGAPIRGSVRLVPQEMAAGAQEPQSIQTDASGRFAFTAVAAGGYAVETYVTNGASGRHEYAAQGVTVTNVDPAPITLRTAPGATLSGRLVLEGAAGRQLWGYTILARRSLRSGASAFNATMGGPYPDGTPLTIRDLWGPVRVQFSSPDESWFLKSIVINGVDAVDTTFDFGTDGRTFDGVEVIFAANPASIGGRAVDGRGEPVNEYLAVVFPVDDERWFAGSRWLKAARPGTNGEFVVKGLPPGEYYVAAVDRLDGTSNGAWQTVEFLHGLVSGASRVSAGPGAPSTATLRVIRR
jgi:hypothetical protein